ncbi:hypothetical protein CAPTEDRAFT_189144 [Capitella teleta]|uniref:Fibrinogen C-terminal domain-containing protein n=1 Tax=Capitella teleta TaxID=283909 RepID=R7T8L3_CAPTE|nr:hypothetical protein CAPTEDRAFT_189144 [Capitella teleta]|eukprot:ELT87344.1 hypothetical protein CAPTEDRAFT_189144 [Capitella teleta]
MSFKNCKDIQMSGHTKSGVYTICCLASRSIQVIQRRVDGSQNFKRLWNEYKSGFGNVAVEFWLGDSMTPKHNGMKFSTIDNENNDGSCASVYKGAWWYHGCHSCNPNGIYLNGSHTNYGEGINWGAWKGHHYSLPFLEMKIRPHY